MEANWSHNWVCILSTLQFTEYPQIYRPIICPTTLLGRLEIAGQCFLLYFYYYFTEEETEAQNPGVLPNIPWLSSGGWITKASLPPSQQVVPK